MICEDCVKGGKNNFADRSHQSWYWHNRCIERNEGKLTKDCDCQHKVGGGWTHETKEPATDVVRRADLRRPVHHEGAEASDSPSAPTGLEVYSVPG